MLLTGSRVARTRYGSQVVAAMTAAMTPMTASRISGSSAALNPWRRRETASSTAISTTVKAP